MLKKLLDKLTSRGCRKILDQIGHFTWALVALAPLAAAPGPVTGVASGFLLALPRELVDQWPVENWRDTAIDLLFFGMGGGLAGALLCG